MKILKITNLKTGQVQQSDFKTIEELNEHFNKHKWGEEEKTIVHPAYEITHEEIPAHVDENGVVIAPAIPVWIETIPERIEVVPCEYIKEIIDTDADEETKRVKKETKHADRISRVDQLKAIDWATTDSIAELKAIVRTLVKEAIKDDE